MRLKQSLLRCSLLSNESGQANIIKDLLQLKFMRQLSFLLLISTLTIVACTAQIHAKATPFSSTLSSTKPETKLAQAETSPYIGLIYSEVPEGLISGGGAVIDQWHRVHVVEQPGKAMYLWLGELLRYDQVGQPVTQVLDVLELPPFSKSQMIAFRFCRLNGKVDREITAIVEMTETEYYTQVSHAWRVNTQTGKIEVMSTHGVDCQNQGWGS